MVNFENAFSARFYTALAVILAVVALSQSCRKVSDEKASDADGGSGIVGTWVCSEPVEGGMSCKMTFTFGADGENTKLRLDYLGDGSERITVKVDGGYKYTSADSVIRLDYNLGGMQMSYSDALMKNIRANNIDFDQVKRAMFANMKGAIAQITKYNVKRLTDTELEVVDQFGEELVLKKVRRQ